MLCCAVLCWFLPSLGAGPLKDTLILPKKFKVSPLVSVSRKPLEALGNSRHEANPTLAEPLNQEAEARLGGQFLGCVCPWCVTLGSPGPH